MALQTEIHRWNFLAANISHWKGFIYFYVVVKGSQENIEGSNELLPTESLLYYIFIKSKSQEISMVAASAAVSPKTRRMNPFKES